MPTFTPLAHNLTTCHRCPHSGAPARGACACTIDGRDIADHARAGDCPQGRFVAGAIPSLQTPRKIDIPLAGDVVEVIAAKIGADRLAKWWERQTGRPCGCEERKAKLNAASERLMKWWARRTVY